MYTISYDLLKYCESISMKQCRHPEPTFFLYLDKLRVTEELLTVTNKMALRQILTLVLPDLHSIIVP
jgi:hypothetical protein